jgi:tetratricopeptide (TPR) repeat protein
VWLAARKVLAGRKEPGNALIKRGRALEEQGRFDSALRHYRIAEKEFRKSGNTAGLAKAVFLQGIILKHCQKYGKAMECFLEAETLCRKLGDRESLAHDFMCMGEMQEEQDCFDDAERRFADAVDIWRDLKLPDHYAYACFRHGSALARLGRHADAVIVFEKAGKVYKKQLNTESVSQIFVEKAVCKTELGDREAALEDYRQAEKLLKRAGMKDGAKEMRRRIEDLESSE